MKSNFPNVAVLAISIILSSCQKEIKQIPKSETTTTSPQNKLTRNKTVMPATGDYSSWIRNALATTNGDRLTAFYNSFKDVEPQHASLKYTMVNVSVDELGQGSIGIIVEPKNPDIPMDGGIYTTPTGESYKYMWVLGNDGFWYPGISWNIGGSWIFFPFDRQGQIDNNMFPYDSGIDMDGLALYTHTHGQNLA